MVSEALATHRRIRCVESAMPGVAEAAISTGLVAQMEDVAALPAAHELGISL